MIWNRPAASDRDRASMLSCQASTSFTVMEVSGFGGGAAA